MAESTTTRETGSVPRSAAEPLRYATRRRPCTFLLDENLVRRARDVVGEAELVRSIEAALVAAIDYTMWVREVEAGERAAHE